MALERPFLPEYSRCGCFEYHASGEGLAKIANDTLHRTPRKAPLSILSEPSTAHDVFVAFDRGDPVARIVVTQAIEFWGMAVANLVSLFDPEKIIFGGGVFGPAARHLRAIHGEAARWGQPIAMSKVELCQTALGSEAGLYGAAYLALRAVDRNR